MNLSKIKNKKGFTLIEMLIIITILGILSSIITINIRKERARSRDAVRISNLKQFSAGLSLFYDNYGMYPCGDSYTPGNPYQVDGASSCPFLDGDGSNSSWSSGTSLPPVCVHAPNPICTEDPKYGLYRSGIISSHQPQDPIQSPAAPYDYSYLYTATLDRSKYLLQTRLEENSELMLNDGGLCDNLHEIGNGLKDINLIAPGQFTVPCN